MTEKDYDAEWENIEFADPDSDAYTSIEFASVDDIFETDKTNPISEVTTNTKDDDFEDSNYSALKLFNFEYEELPKLLEPIFPKVGLASLVGSSDTGKSTFLRQLALSVTLGLNEFAGYKLNPTSQNVIYISTEDDPTSTSISIKKSVSKILQNTQKDLSLLNHLKFIFEVETNPESPKNIIKVLKKDLDKKPIDLIIVDAFTDIFSGDINSSTKVREFLNQFSTLAKKYNCLILFLHHTGKKTSKFSASKDHVLGSQAFEAKMRVLVELKQFPNSDNLRTLTITKGNYISSQIKKFSKVLNFDEEHLLFSDTGRELLSDSIATLAYTNPKKDSILPIIQKMHDEKKSIRQIEAELKKQGFEIGKSSVANYLKEIKSANIIENTSVNNNIIEFENIDFSNDFDNSNPPDFVL